MELLKFTVRNQHLSGGRTRLVSDSIDYVEADFDFRTEDWDGLSKWAHFTKGETVYDINLVNDKITRDMHLNLGTGIWEVKLHGTDPAGTMRITTDTTYVKVDSYGSLEEGSPLPEIPLSAAEQIDAKSQLALDNSEEAILNSETALAKATAVEEAAANGEFDGKDGEKGDTGATPVISIGNLETLAPDEEVMVTVEGTPEYPVFNFGIPKGDKGDPGESAFESAQKGGYTGSVEDFYGNLAFNNKVSVGEIFESDSFGYASLLNHSRMAAPIFCASKGESENIKINSVGCYASGAGSIRFILYSWDGALSGGVLSPVEVLGEISMAAAGEAILNLEHYYTELDNICVVAAAETAIIGMYQSTTLTVDGLLNFDDGNYYSAEGNIATTGEFDEGLVFSAYSYGAGKLITLQELADNTYGQDDIAEERIAEIEGDISAIEQEIADLKYDPIAIDSFSHNAGTRENGDTVSSVVLSWVLNKAPASVTVEGNAAEAVQSGSYTLNESIAATRTFSMSATDERNATATKSTAINFYDGIYYGTAAKPDSVDSAFVLSLSKVLSSNKNRTVNVSGGEGKYFWYAYPESMGTSAFVIDGFTYEFESETVSFTNAFGVIKNYLIYVSDNPMLSDKSVTVKGV